MLDKELLRSAITNLLSNAVKYSPEGSTVQFTLSCDAQRFTLQIRDHGIGIPAEDQKRIFTQFQRAKNVGTTPGTGLGLAITAEAVRLHGGTIKVESDLGVGTVFTITIPLVQHTNGGN